MERTVQLRQTLISPWIDMIVSRSVVWKYPWFLFPSIDGIALWRYVMLSVQTEAVNYINYPESMSLNCHLFRVWWICTPHTTILSQLTSQEICEFSIPKSHKHKCPRLYYFCKCAYEDNPAPLPLNWSPQSTPPMFWWYLVTYSGQKTFCISWTHLLDTSVITVFLKLLMNWSVL